MFRTMFRMNGYVQDERYIAIEHMDVRRDCVNFAHCFILGAVPLSFAQSFYISMAAKVAWSLFQDMP